jgi:hypothetical protein
VPENWTPDQIASYQKYWSGLEAAATFTTSSTRSWTISTFKTPMPVITISPSAVEKIAKESAFRRLRQIGSEDAVPLLRYYQRSYSTSNDGSIIEHGDGFGLHFVDPTDLDASGGIVYQTIAIGDGTNVVVGVPAERLSGGFSIDWSKNKFFLEPSIA